MEVLDLIQLEMLLLACCAFLGNTVEAWRHWLFQWAFLLFDVGVPCLERLLFILFRKDAIERLRALLQGFLLILLQFFPERCGVGLFLYLLQAICLLLKI